MLIIKISFRMFLLIEQRLKCGTVEGVDAYYFYNIIYIKNLK